MNDTCATLHVRDGRSDQTNYELATSYKVEGKLTRREFERRQHHDTKMGRSKAGLFRAANEVAFKNEGFHKMKPSWVLEILKNMECNK